MSERPPIRRFLTAEERYDEELAQLEPETRTLVEEWHAARARAHEVPRRPDEPDPEVVRSMEELPGGDNEGHAGSPNAQVEGRWLPLSALGMQTQAFLIDSGGFVVVDSRYGKTRGSVAGARDAGMRAHRGVLHPSEYVDLPRLVRVLFGVPIEVVHDVYARPGGPCPRDLLPLRDKLDARIAKVADAGHELAPLARALGVGERALQRAAERGKR